MPRNTILIKSYEDTVMVFRVFIKCFNVDEMLDNITSNETFLH